MVRLTSHFLIATLFFMIAHGTNLPRQDTPAVGTLLSTSTSSFNWWPYPAGGIITSISSLQVPTLAIETSTSVSSFSSSPTPVASSSTLRTKATSHSSETPVMHITALASPPATSPSSDPKSLLKSGGITLSPLWLVPVCLLLGGIVGCALGWLAWRRFGERGDRNRVGHTLDGYAWPYKHETEHEHDEDKDDDVERGRGHEYLSLGRGPNLHVDQGPQRVPSTANTSGARAWIGHPQARKRSGAVGPSQTNTFGVHEPEDSVDVKSPLLTQSEVHEDSKQASPLPSPYSYGDEDGDGVGDEGPYETIRHKSVRRRIWERLGFAESDQGRKKSKTHEEEGRHTWSAGAMQERGAEVGRTFSLWGRRKTMKEGRVERWVRSVRGEEERDSCSRPAHQEAPTGPIDSCEETLPQHGTPELVLSTLRRVSPKPWHSRRFDNDLSMAPDLVELFSPTSYHSSPTLDTHTSTITTTVSGQREGLRYAEKRSRGVSLQDPGPIARSGSVSQSTIKRTVSTSRDAFPPRPTPSSRSKPSQRSTSSPAPPSPSSVSRYSATPHTPAPATLNRSPTRTPSRRTVSRETRPSLARAVPSSSRLARPTSNTTTPPSARLARPVSVSNTTPARDDSGTPPRTRPSPGRGAHAVAQRRAIPELPAGPSSVTTPPLHSALSFDDTLSLAASRAPTTGSARYTTSSRTPGQSSKRVSTTGSIPANARTRATPPRSIHPSPDGTPVAVPESRPFSPKERHLARRNANARVEMILSRSYSSRNFDERPISPTMFGAVISEEVEGGRLGDGHDVTHETLTFVAENEGGIEQRLDKLRRYGV